MKDPRLPEWVMSRAEGRPSTSDINSLASEPREKTITATANGAMCPIIYGETQVTGMIFAIGKISTDLVVGYIWGIGEIEGVVDLFINDSTLDPSITVTHYTGTPTQGVDPTLASAIVAYADTLRIDTPTGKRGLAYSVVRIPSGVLEGFPKARATIKGRKIYNPLTGITEWTDKPALCFADMVMDTDYGLGSSITSGLQECVNWNDTLLGGVSPRARLSLVLSDGRLTTDYLKLLAEYAECWYSFDGVGIKMTPDAPVDLDTVDTITPEDMVESSLVINKKTSLDTPTEVEVRYTQPSGDATPWEAESVTQALTGVETGTVVRIPTTLSLEGVYRLEEANNRALSKLNRVSNRLSVTWNTFDSGLIRQVGDVVKLSSPLRGIAILPVRVISVKMTSYGRYSISAENYDINHYPSEIDTGGDGIVPVGVIALLQGEVLPSGWSYYTAADGKYIKSFSDTEAVLSTGGSQTFTGFSGTTTTNGNHLGTTTFPVEDNQSSGGGTVGYLYDNLSQGGHSHTYSTGGFDPELYTRQNRLVIKTGTPSLEIPKNVMTLGLEGILDPNAGRVNSYASRYLAANSSDLNSGLATKTLDVLSTGYTDDEHTHGKNYYNNLIYTPDFAQEVFDHQSGGGVHNHFSNNVVIQRLLRTYPVALYGGVNNYSVKAGRMFLWAGDVNTLPEDFVIVEEAKGRFLQLAGQIVGEPFGDNTLSINTQLNTVGHSHKGESFIIYRTTFDVFHENTQQHSHTITNSATWEPEYITLAVIMYQPVD